MKKLLILFITSLAISTFAQEPIYKFSFDDTANAKFLGERDVTIFPLSDRAKPILNKNRGRDVQAADYISGIVVKTENPDIAAQEIFNQLSEKTGETIGRSFNSITSKANPTQILMGYSKTSVWNLVLSPHPEGNYVLTISYLIEK